MLSPPISLLAVSAHQVEVAETLIRVGCFLVIFLSARLIVELMVRLQLPAILGELVAGVIIGASGLHLILPAEAHAELNGAVVSLISATAGLEPGVVVSLYGESMPTLQAVAQLGLFALLFLTGLESELDELLAVGRQATTVAVAGVVLPFLLGTMGLHGLFHVPLMAAVFAGAAMTATSIGITASVFGELRWLRRREGRIVIGAAVLDDILGIVILAVVVALAGGGAVTAGPIVRLLLVAGAFVAMSLLLSRRVAPHFDRLIDWLQAPGDLVVASFVVLTACCFTAQAIGLEAALGAFAAGLILSGSRHTHDIRAAVQPLVALFATVFFVLIGTGMDLSVLNPLDPANRQGLVIAVFLLTVAIAGKVAAGWCYLSPDPGNRLVVGLGMMPRGEVGLIFLGLGSQSGLLSAPLEAGILFMVIGTTFLAPVLLRRVIAAQSTAAESLPDGPVAGADASDGRAFVGAGT